MKITGSNTVAFPVERVWNALLDPQVLVAAIPGCERLVALLSTAGGEHAYDMTVTAGVAAIRGTYQGTCTLSDLKEHESLVMRLSGAGAPGTIDATVHVSFAAPSADTTEISYAADAIVGGMVGGVGQRMLSSVSRRMAGEFFGNVAQLIAEGPAGGVEAAVDASAAPETPTRAGAVAPGQTFSAPPRPAAVSSQDDFLKGVAVGAGLVVLGVVVGSLFGRRR